MQALLLIERRLKPEPRRVRQDVVGEAEDTFYIEFVEPGIVEFDLGDRDLFTDLVALAVACGLVDCALRLLDAVRAFNDKW